MRPEFDSFMKENYKLLRWHELSVALKNKYQVNIADDALRKYCGRKGWRKRTEFVGPFEKVVFITCLHIPFHDNKLLCLLYSFLDYFKPDKLFILGDYLDWYVLSFFDKDPKRLGHLQNNLDTGKKILDELTKRVEDIEFVDGNHEYRLTRHLKKNPQFYGLKCLTIPALLNLGKRNIKHHHYLEPPMKYHGFQIHHGSLIRKHSGWTAKAHFEKYGGCGIIGHSHRGGNYIKRTREGICGWYENMCMCSLKPEYLGFADWVQGWSVAYFTKKDLFHLEQIPVIDHQFLFQGELFGAKG